MRNQFYMLYGRFHVTEENKFLICGYWKDNISQDAKLLAALDYTPVVVTVEKQKTIKNPNAYVQQGQSEEKAFCWITLPDHYEKYKRLRVFERQGLELKEIFSAETAWVNSQQKVHMHIDEIAPGNDGTIIRGWCIAKERYEIEAADATKVCGQKKKTVQRRPDVELAYPECEREWIHGFILETKQGVKGKIKITVRCDGREAIVKGVAHTSTARNAFAKGKEICRKTRVYYQQFGIQRTFARGFEKLMRKEYSSYEHFRRKYFPSQKQLDRQRRERFAYEPEFSIVVPLYRTPKCYLDALVQSIQEQTYGRWTLFFSDGSGPDSPLQELLKGYVRRDRRIRVFSNECRLQIAENTNVVLAKADGDFIVFTDHDDTLAPDALYECVKSLNECPEADVIYTDEDKISMDGKTYYQPHFKPDFNIDLLRSANYMCHLYVVRRTLLEQVGYLNPEYEGSQDYDFILRCIEKTDRIIHIPKILYHWRIHPDSVAGNPESKMYAYEAGRMAILEHYKRVGISADIDYVSPGYYRSIYEMKEEPLLSIIIPNKDHKKDLKKCIESIQRKSAYGNYEILVVENNSESREIQTYYKELEAQDHRIRILYYKKAFNYSAIQNFAAQRAKGQYLLLLNNDTWMEEKTSIREMLSYCMRKDVGIVGAKLLYPDDTIQHAGVIVGLGGVAGHAFAGAQKEDPGYFCRITCAQDYSAVTAACMMVKKSVFDAVGGLDTNLQVAFNDTDFCMRVREKGYLVVYQPAAVWYHDESKTRGLEDTEEKLERFRQEIEFFQRRWALFLKKGDPCYNPNLALDRHDFSLKC